MSNINTVVEDESMEEEYYDDDPVETLDGRFEVEPSIQLAPLPESIRTDPTTNTAPTTNTIPRSQLERDITLLLVKNPELKFDAQKNGILKKLQKLTDQELEELLFNLEIQQHSLRVSKLGTALAVGFGNVMERVSSLQGLGNDIAGDMEIQSYLGNFFAQWLPEGTNIWGFFIRVGLHLQAAISSATTNVPQSTVP
jgi:hypothetical protein